MEPDYIVIGRHVENGIVFELVVLKDDIHLIDNGVPLWLHNPKVRISREPSDQPVNEVLGHIEIAPEHG